MRLSSDLSTHSSCVINYVEKMMIYLITFEKMKIYKHNYDQDVYTRFVYVSFSVTKLSISASISILRAMLDSALIF